MTHDEIVALHESAHAVIAWRFNVGVHSISADLEAPIVRYNRGESLTVPPLAMAAACIAGPIASNLCYGTTDSDDDLLAELYEEVRWNVGTVVDLRRSRRLSILASEDDFSQVVDCIIRHHYFSVRAGSIASDVSILRHYRELERRIKVVCETNARITALLAKELLARPDRSMSGAEFAERMKNL